MTTFATRPPLQLLLNTHVMSDSQRTTRRTSARLADKEDHPTSNEGGSVQEKRGGNTVNGGSSTQVKINGGSARGKRKKGGCFHNLLYGDGYNHHHGSPAHSVYSTHAVY